MATLEARTADEMVQIGERIGRLLRPGDAVLIQGELGAGKTTLAQGIARGLGVAAPVTSPTFALIHEHRGAAARMAHVDPYRLRDEEEVEGTGFLDLLEGDAVLVVEWPERLGALAPPDHLHVRIERGEGDVRRLAFSGTGMRGAAIAAELEQSC